VNGYNFTNGIRVVLGHAREEAARLHHEYVGTEHMLLGLLRRDEGVAITVLRDLGIDLERMRTQIEEIIRVGPAASRTGPDLPYTTRAKYVLELAMTTAREMQHSYVGSEHLLLGMLREQKGVAAQALADARVTEANAREGVLKILGTAVDLAPHRAATAQGALRPVVTPALTSVVVEMRYDGGWRRRREFSSAEGAMAFLAEQR
jgi:ATP-dependent Clp protease ATP-binding subunit ClpC